MYYRGLENVHDIRCHRSSSNNQRKQWDLRNPVCMTPNGVKEGVEGKSSPWLAAKGQLSLKSTFSSEGALGYGGKKAEVEELWREFFLDPTEWRDHRPDKMNPRFPDFKHTTQPHKALWLDSQWIPPWVEEKMVSIPPGSLRLSAFAWNQHLRRYAQAGQHEKTIELFQHMQRGCETVDTFTFVTVLKACSSLGLLEQGRRVHTMMKPGFEVDLHVGTCLVDMYAKCGSIEEAARVFEKIPTRDVVTFSAMINGYVKYGEGQKALELFEQMQVEGVDPNPVTFVGIINACASVAAIDVGRRIHEEVIRRGYESDVVVGTCLVDMYAKCRSIEEAERLFDQMPTRDVVTFNAMLSGYVKCGEGQKALELFEQMQGQGVDPNPVTFAGVLNACANLAAIEKGRRMHEEIIHRGYESDLIVGTCLVDMYAKCGSIEEAERVFEQMPTRDVVTFSAMISGYAKCREGQKAVELFEQMQGQGVDPDPVTFVGVLNACASIAAIEGGRRIHEEVVRRGYESDIIVGNCLVDMYAKCGRIEEAKRVFEQMPTRDVVTFSAMISGYVKCGEGQKALELFEQMQWQEVYPNPITFVGVLNACASDAAIEEGRHIHEEIIRRGYESEVVVGTCLIDMYAKCGSIEEAERVFDQMPTRDVVTFNAMLSGYVKCGEGQKALELFEQMRGQRVNPNPATFAGVLNACANLAAMEEGRRMHEDIIHRGYESDLGVGTSLIDMYSKCGSLEEAERVFDQMPTRDVVTFSAMISGYAKCGEGHKALELFEQMQGQGVDPDLVTFVGVLNACASVAAIEGGRRIHEEIIHRGYELDVVVGNCLVDMYTKCGSIEEAERVFDQMPTRDVVTFSAMISGYTKCGEGQKALELFEQMQGQGVDPNPVTFVGILNACASVAAIEGGRCIHEEIIRRGYELDIIVANCLVDMYAKCGSIEEAERVFNKMPTRDVVTWNAMLAGYGTHGYAKRALETFKEMCKAVKVNGVTFICLLSACSHVGLVAEGLQYFKSMTTVYNITPTVEHFACVVDILGRAGRLSEAEDLILSMPVDPNASVWMALLGACRAHVNVELGERCVDRVLELEPDNAASYVLLANIYVAAGKFDSSARLNEERLDTCVKKIPARTWIEVEAHVHSFVVDDHLHARIGEIHVELDSLSRKMNDFQYLAETKLLWCVNEEVRKYHLCCHSERLAIAFGLLSTAPGTPLLIRKNLQLCRDCHTDTKVISKIVGRAITVKDANRFHQFQDGLCCCGNYF